MTTIAILGQGNMGKGLASRLKGKVDLVLGAREPKAGEVSYAEAVAKADIVVFGLFFDAILEAAKTLPLDGKIVVDMTNVLTPDYSALRFDSSTSAGEELQKAIPSAKIVKGFNTIFSSLFALAPAATANVPIFLAGNDDAAVEAVADLSRKAGFTVEKAGKLDGARLLEALGMLNIRLAFQLGRGSSIAPAFINVA